jgi:uncharacterized protein
VKKTVVIGASPNRSRYAYKAVGLLTEYGHPVVAIGRRSGMIDGVEIKTGMPVVTDVDTVTLYLAPGNQPAVYDYILKVIKPKRIIFNPGTENDELAKLAEGKGIEVVEHCTLIMLNRSVY